MDSGVLVADSMDSEAAVVGSMGCEAVAGDVVATGDVVVSGDVVVAEAVVVADCKDSWLGKACMGSRYKECKRRDNRLVDR